MLKPARRSTGNKHTDWTRIPAVVPMLSSRKLLPDSVCGVS